MKTLTVKQQSLIDNLRSEFEKINESTGSSSLIDLKSLMDEANKTVHGRREIDAYNRAINQADADYMNSICDQLNADFTKASVPLFVDKYNANFLYIKSLMDKEYKTGHFDGMNVKIELKRSYENTPYGDRLSNKKQFRSDESENGYYPSVEELLADEGVQYAIRRLVIRTLERTTK